VAQFADNILMGASAINASVNTMDQSTQQNAAMVEQSTAAAYKLASEAEALFHCSPSSTSERSRQRAVTNGRR
jgi:methyl-accepting chemotaxis protein